jgi:hypothetical protein
LCVNAVSQKWSASLSSVVFNLIRLPKLLPDPRDAEDVFLTDVGRDDFRFPHWQRNPIVTIEPDA